MARQPKPQEPDPSPPAPAVTTGPSAEEAPGILTIDLAAIGSNYRALAQRVLPAECAAVVKADAYGCGIEPVVTALTQAGCRTYFVAHLAEARRVRAVAKEADIYVLNGFPVGTGPAFAECGARPVINSSVELAEWDSFVQQSSWRGGAAVHVDTGMNRLGLSLDEAAAIAGRMQTEQHGLALLMSHFAWAEKPEHPLNEQQIRQFREIRTLFRGIPGSLANSAGIFLDASAHCDMVRPGVALYGVNPTPRRPNPMQPVISLQCSILQIRDVPAGASVGYQAAWVAPRPSRIAIIAAGYADGILRAAAETDGEAGRHVLIAGQRCRIVGRISMDLLAADITALGEGAVRRGHMATLIGGDLTLDAVASEAGTIGYEVLTALGRRFHRVWKT